jgi:hypothetical protein
MDLEVQLEHDDEFHLHDVNVQHVLLPIILEKLTQKKKMKKILAY